MLIGKLMLQLPMHFFFYVFYFSQPEYEVF